MKTVRDLVDERSRHHYDRLLKYPREALAAQLAMAWPPPSYTLLDAVAVHLVAIQLHVVQTWLLRHQGKVQRILTKKIGTPLALALVRKYARKRRQYDLLLTKVKPSPRRDRASAKKGAAR